MINKKVIVGMSGGVDSSVAAWMLKKQGYYIEGLFMKNWEEDDTEEFCNIAKDLEDAQKVCDQLNIKLHTINFSVEYWEHVFIKFIEHYKLGLTPNPDILCNKKIKFKTFLNFSKKKLDADYIATGHYVRKFISNNKIKLLRGIDKNKDQSYFLYTLNKKQIKQSLFPIGEFKKHEIRKIASKLKLITANKKDSTGICFIGKKNFPVFLNRYIPFKEGMIIDTRGNKIGLHKGISFYTIGQRKGLNIKNNPTKNTKPWYVVNKDIHHNIIIVAQGKNNPNLMSTRITVHKFNFINKNTLHKKIKCTAKIRYRHSDVKCVILPISNNKLYVIFNDPVSSISPGQSIVFYKNELCLGGGIIKNKII